MPNLVVILLQSFVIKLNESRASVSDLYLVEFPADGTTSPGPPHQKVPSAGFSQWVFSQEDFPDDHFQFFSLQVLSEGFHPEKTTDRQALSRPAQKRYCTIARAAARTAAAGTSRPPELAHSGGIVRLRIHHFNLLWPSNNAQT